MIVLSQQRLISECPRIILMGNDLDKEIDDAVYQSVYAAGSALRTELTNDLLSRRSAPSV
jgi:hypothetical protein